jgi:adenosylcobinamide-GDP ribazoletransferase
MKSGSAGPAGVAALVVVLGVQAASLAAYDDWVLVALLVCASRAALWITCVRGVPAARRDGLGSAFTSSVPRPFVVVGWLALAGLSALVDPWRGPVAVVAAASVVALLVHRSVRRFGGVTGDVFGAAIELALAVLLLGFASVQGL